MTGFTYSFKDRSGVEHNRYSAGHVTPRYVAAVIRYRDATGTPGKAQVSYSSRHDLAHSEMVREFNRTYKGKRCWHSVEVVELTATPGRPKP